MRSASLFLLCLLYASASFLVLGAVISSPARLVQREPAFGVEADTTITKRQRKNGNPRNPSGTPKTRPGCIGSGCPPGRNGRRSLAGLERMHSMLEARGQPGSEGVGDTQDDHLEQRQRGLQSDNADATVTKRQRKNGNPQDPNDWDKAPAHMGNPCVGTGCPKHRRRSLPEPEGMELMLEERGVGNTGDDDLKRRFQGGQAKNADATITKRLPDEGIYSWPNNPIHKGSPRAKCTGACGPPAP